MLQKINGSAAPGNVHINHQNKEKMGSHFSVCGMMVDAKQADLSISITADLMGFSHTTVSGD